MKTKLLYFVIFSAYIGGQTVPTSRPIGTNPGNERRWLQDNAATISVGGQVVNPRT